MLVVTDDRFLRDLEAAAAHDAREHTLPAELDEPTRAEAEADEASWKADRWRRQQRYGPDEP